MRAKKVVGWFILIGLGGLWLADHWPHDESQYRLKDDERPSVSPNQGSDTEPTPSDVDERREAKKRSRIDAEFLSEQQRNLQSSPLFKGSFVGRWSIMSGPVNIPELHLKIDDIQDFTITPLVRTQPKAYMSFLVSGQIIPCGADRIAVQFGNGEMVALHNLTHFCPKGYVLFNSEESQASRISALLNANQNPPVAVSYGTSSFYLSRSVEPEDMQLLLHAIDTCASDGHCTGNASVKRAAPTR